MSKAGGSDSKNTLYCSFCGKSQHEVRKLTASDFSLQSLDMRLTRHDTKVELWKCSNVLIEEELKELKVTMNQLKEEIKE